VRHLAVLVDVFDGQIEFAVAYCPLAEALCLLAWVGVARVAVPVGGQFVKLGLCFCVVQYGRVLPVFVENGKGDWSFEFPYILVKIGCKTHVVMFWHCS
jgi:hypothetical protein